MPISSVLNHAAPLVADVPFALGWVVAQAESAAPAPEAAPDFVRTLVSTLPIAFILVAGYLLLLRPEREKQRRQQECLAGLKKNDRVLTSSGIYGTVANVDREGDRVSLKVDDAANVKITVTLSSIARVVGDRHAGDTDTTRTSRDEP